MEKQSNYWHISKKDLENLCHSVYELTSNFDKFGVVKREYNNLRKFSGVPAVSDLLKHSELVYGKKNLIGKIKEFENSPTDKFFHVGLDELDSYVVENISE
jgi:hypothetical protein